MKPHDKDELTSWLRRIAGQVAGIQRMVEEDRRPLDVATQVSAVRGGLAKITGTLLTSHFEETAALVLGADSARERRELIDELVRLFERRET